MLPGRTSGPSGVYLQSVLTARGEDQPSLWRAGRPVTSCRQQSIEDLSACILSINYPVVRPVRAVDLPRPRILICHSSTIFSPTQFRQPPYSSSFLPITRQSWPPELQQPRPLSVCFVTAPARRGRRPAMLCDLPWTHPIPSRLRVNLPFHQSLRILDSSCSLLKKAMRCYL